MRKYQKYTKSTASPSDVIKTSFVDIRLAVVVPLNRTSNAKKNPFDEGVRRGTVAGNNLDDP